MAGALFNAASKMYTRTGRSSQVNLVGEIAIATALGTVFGGAWKVQTLAH